jgi:acetyl coenzyme A synthetase (ADP forming)-like protein
VAAYPAEYDFHVVLRDGGLARIRPVLPDDADRMKAMFRRMGRESIYLRFFSHKGDVSDEEIEFFATVDYDERMAFVAEIGRDIVAVGRYDRMEDDPSAAEVSFSVEDAHHGRGLGSHLLSHLTNYARNNGVSAFRAFVLAENYPMMRLFRGSGYRMKRGMGEGVYEVEFPVERSEEALAVESAHEQKSVANSLLPIFYPRSVAIIGASREHRSIGGRVMRNVLDAHFNGAVFPVNPSAPAVGSVKAYRSVLDIPDPIDVAVIVVPGRFVIPVVEECAQKGVKGLVVISAGFSETGGEGVALEQELLDVVRVSGMRMIGPNCMGMLNTDPAVNLDLTFAPTYPPRGNVAMSSQSGALGIAILDYADQLEIGISSFVSVGNSADVSANDLLLYWEGDPSTDVILLYVESFGQPRRFARVARRIGKQKPIIAVKSGRTSAGARAASSHTGALASVEVAVSALFRQSGVIRVDTLEQMFEAASLLANQPLPNGRRVAVLTNAGGPGILCVDALESEGLEVPEFSDELQARLQEHLSTAAAVRNPVDMIASAGSDHYAACMEALLESDEIDAVIVIFIPTSPGALLPIHESVHEAAAAKGEGKTILTVFMEADAGEIPSSPDGVPRLPTYTFPEPAARALARAARYGEWRQRPEGEFVDFEDIDPDAAKEVIWEALQSCAPCMSKTL